jgi:uncharacterized membrane protein
MSEPTLDPTAPATPAVVDDDKVMPVVIYVLYLLGWVTAGVTPVIGFFMAYAQKGRASPTARSHFVFQIRTGWISLIVGLGAALLMLLGLPLMIILVGFALLQAGLAIFGLLGVWVTVRAVVGLIYASRNDPYPRPDAWII